MLLFYELIAIISGSYPILFDSQMQLAQLWVNVLTTGFILSSPYYDAPNDMGRVQLKHRPRFHNRALRTAIHPPG